MLGGVPTVSQPRPSHVSAAAVTGCVTGRGIFTGGTEVRATVCLHFVPVFRTDKTPHVHVSCPSGEPLWSPSGALWSLLQEPRGFSETAARTVDDLWIQLH